ncbi:hypothetical protein NDU88_002294 [Pleurodeles waltl]|uniref:Secreted protein n=1 Tax=Pleurodeles waltl TaxID=8319 RepID=A0AAV7R9Q4_PLEWA|nr:hypothetical protein NDU88_002294 [Pleurodeles waltl]
MQPRSCSHTRCAGAMATAVVCRALLLSMVDATVDGLAGPKHLQKQTQTDPKKIKIRAPANQQALSANKQRALAQRSTNRPVLVEINNLCAP